MAQNSMGLANIKITATMTVEDPPKPVSVGVPFQESGGRQCLTGLVLVENEEVAAFVKRFPKCFARDIMRDVVWFYPNGDAPEYEPLGA